jgi:hypothetical protein
MTSKKKHPWVIVEEPDLSLTLYSKDNTNPGMKVVKEFPASMPYKKAHEEYIRMSWGTSAAVLRKSLEIAVKYGYSAEGLDVLMYELEHLSRDGVYIKPKDYYHIIFSHPFAKAFWHHTKYWRTKNDRECWEFHLGQMAIREYPLDYINQFL